MRFVLSLVIVIAAASPAAAQSFPRDDFSAHRFYVAPGPNNFVLVDGGEVGPNLVPTFGATMGYLHRPFAVDDLDWYRACEEGRSPPSGTSYLAIFAQRVNILKIMDLSFVVFVVLIRNKIF